MCDHRVVNNTFEDFATDRKKRDRSVVFNTRLVVFYVNWNNICFFPFWWENALRQTKFENNLKRLQMDFLHNLSIRILIISLPWALFELSWLIMFLISIPYQEVNIREWFVCDQKKEWRLGNVLPLSINEHCFAEKELTILLFFLSQWQLCYRKKGNFSTIYNSL